MHDRQIRLAHRRGHWAEEHARNLLQPLGDRWLHVRGVGRRAERVCEILAESEREALVAAAYLHDVGYAPELRKEGVHQLDGAHFARSIGVDDRVVNLIAHHSEARFEVALRGRAEALSEFVREESAVSDALTYCDLTTGPTGRLVNVGARLAEVRQRYEAGGVVMRALEEATPRLLAAVARTERRLRAAGLGSLVV